LFHLGEQEHFLLVQLDGEKDLAAICRAFSERFNESLSDEDLDGFIEMARAKGLLEEAEADAVFSESPSDQPWAAHAH
jgi:hypothetical protein